MMAASFQPAYPIPLTELRLSHSSRELLKNCERKFEFIKIYRHPRAHRELPPECGKAIHAGFQEWMVSKDFDAAVWQMMLNYPIDLCSDEENRRSIQVCYAALKEMCENLKMGQYEIAQIKCLDGKVRNGVEVPFEIEIVGFDFFGLPVRYIGYIDLVLYDIMSHGYLVDDIKSTTWNLKDKTPIYKYDNQCLPYGLFLPALLDFPVDELEVRYTSIFLDAVSPKVNLYPFTKDSGDIQRWVKGLLMDLNNLRFMYQNTFFPRRSDNCIAWNKVCPFFENGLCDMDDPETIQNFLLMNRLAYKEKPFVPWIKMQLNIGDMQ